MEQTPDAEVLANQLFDIIDRMDGASREYLIAMLRERLLQDTPAIPMDSGELHCPVCGSADLVKNGHTQKNTQRWTCNDCGKTRCAGVGQIMLHTKLPLEKWMDYIPMFVDRISCPKVAKRLQVQPRTAWFMRIRVLEALFKNLPGFQVIAGDKAQIDEIYFRESFKGTRFENMEDPPREPRHKKTEGTVKSGISDDQICVVTGVDDTGQFMYDVACRGALTIEAAKNCLIDRIESGAFIVTDRHRAYPGAIRSIGAAFHEAVSSKDHGKLEKIDHIHSNIRTFMTPFRGVSTKWLHLYLCWFKWLRSYARDGPGLDACERQVFGGTYDHTYSGIKRMDIPFRDASMNPLKFAAH